MVAFPRLLTIRLLCAPDFYAGQSDVRGGFLWQRLYPPQCVPVYGLVTGDEVSYVPAYAHTQIFKTLRVRCGLARRTSVLHCVLLTGAQLYILSSGGTHNQSDGPS